MPVTLENPPTILTPWGRASWNREIGGSYRVVFLTCDNVEKPTSPSRALCFLHMFDTQYHGRVWAGKIGDIDRSLIIRGSLKNPDEVMRGVCRALIQANNFSPVEQLTYADRMFVLEGLQESEK